MNLVNKKVLHGTFGKGNVVSCDNEYIKIDFDSGLKKFVFPDVFREYMTLTDEKAFNSVKKKIQKIEQEEEEKALKAKQAKAFARQRQREREQEREGKKPNIHPEIQSVFWCKDSEEDKIFEQWKIFVGKIKNGEKKGEPRKLARMNQKSACLLTKRESDLPEKKRRILGVFMAASDFNGRSSEDGYITAHPQYKLKLSKEESEKMLFWNYYINKKFPKRKTWNSGKQRYFENVWMAQILRDIVSLKEETEDKEYAQGFFEYFCRVNNINIAQLPTANGALIS